MGTLQETLTDELDRLLGRGTSIDKDQQSVPTETEKPIGVTAEQGETSHRNSVDHKSESSQHDSVENRSPSERQPSVDGSVSPARQQRRRISAATNSSGGNGSALFDQPNAPPSIRSDDKSEAEELPKQQEVIGSDIEDVKETSEKSSTRRKSVDDASADESTKTKENVGNHSTARSDSIGSLSESKGRRILDMSDVEESKKESRNGSLSRHDSDEKPPSSNTSRRLYKRHFPPAVAKQPTPIVQISNATISDSVSLRSAAYQRWLQQKEERKEAERATRREAALKRKEEEKQQQRRREEAEKVFNRWQETKTAQLLERHAEQRRIRKEQLEEGKRQKETKRTEAEQVFMRWKQQREEDLLMKNKEQKRKIERKKKAEEEEKASKMTDAEKCFQQWKQSKDAEIREVAERLRDRMRRKDNRKSTEDLQRNNVASDAYNAWLEKKEQERVQRLYSSQQNLWSDMVNDQSSVRSPPWIPPHRTVPVVNQRLRRRTASASGRFRVRIK